jgi:hypothetical protein
LIPQLGGHVPFLGSTHCGCVVSLTQHILPELQQFAPQQVPASQVVWQGWAMHLALQ